MGPEKKFHISYSKPNIETTEMTLKVAGMKDQVTHKGNSVSVTADFSTETLRPRRAWNSISGPERQLLTWSLYLAKTTLHSSMRKKNFT